MLFGAQANPIQYQYASLPPSPPRHWLWGNISFFSIPYRYVLLATEYKKQLGDIVSVITPLRIAVFVNTAELTTELLEKQAAFTADRPRDVMIGEIMGWNTAVSFRKHDEFHKKMRRVMASALHPAAARSYAPQHLSNTLDLLCKIAEKPETFVDISTQVIGAFILRITYGYEPMTKEDPFIVRVHRAFQHLKYAASTYHLVNDFPILRYVPAWVPGAGFQKLGRKGAELRTGFADEAFKMVFDQVCQGKVKQPCYVSRLLESKGGASVSQEDIELIKWTAASLSTGGTTTTVVLVNSFILMMSLHPEVAEKAQAEIDSVVGRGRIPDFHDRNSLPFTESVIWEIRSGVPHVSTEDIELRGYRIPKGTLIFSNIWAILHDPDYYPSPHTFEPSRFLKHKPEPDPRKFLFGFGRRVCPGLHIANDSSWIICTGLLSLFNIRPSAQLEAKVQSLGGRNSERLVELFEPGGATADPLPFSCDISPRDSVALALLENSSA
ncbi:Cytochrome P450 family oxidoreductase [Ceratobasidium theobromae]|uniref:Cytochrome P450 family oxidoreductase n=1 Tax=Ceratobasidium theobromae TaxID=1582974 RepID=A0A5N5QJI9_9AGAM|nr:Cytochrome P450 family oxidoreductase [Ceratobasidium theobromae]